MKKIELLAPAGDLEKLKTAAKYAQEIGLKVNAGHGLNYKNVYLMKEIKLSK